MKMILPFAAIACLTFAGCTFVPYFSSVTSVDYSRYNNENFYITEANSVSFAYDPVGSVEVVMRSGYKGVYNETSRTTTYSKEPTLVSVYDVIDGVKKECENLGADGVINFKLSFDRVATQYSVWNGAELETGMMVTATGMAIKRK